MGSLADSCFFFLVGRMLVEGVGGLQKFSDSIGLMICPPRRTSNLADRGVDLMGD